ncbi:DUF1992 domain-containing protein [Alkalihalophilus marmarensis]|jgi:hypothetical protein|uniref:DnaJ homologue subfamily C member 28 conserved domain-containing protein n=1 Tax=Alkalihalophilus marmarensis DSM 21297 TaxID=1188261 RepID=U6ST15_9BACI|nr:DnaJ family domain-containing protein [Alkalihalophilus marmarensis]ERN54050.1 hypothetical protein A33I_08755 [Alkalihalophilus marmarensis DSM 21297]MCM3488131.1 DUF1992 domain-containing protein [Alkalihalophilus marmarensis]
MDRPYNDIIGDILEEKGEKDTLKGKGQPLSSNYMKRDTFQHFQKIAKDAGYVPHWLKLQKEIAALIHTCRSASDLELINVKIKEHNLKCPPQMQRNLITVNNLDRAKEVW